MPESVRCRPDSAVSLHPLAAFGRTVAPVSRRLLHWSNLVARCVPVQPNRFAEFYNMLLKVVHSSAHALSLYLRTFLSIRKTLELSVHPIHRRI